MRKNIRSNLKYFILSGVFNTIMLNLYNPFAVKFLQRIGGDEFHISLQNALPGFIGIISSLPGAIYMIRRADKSMKTHTVQFMLISRIFICSFALMVFLPPAVAPWIFVILFALKNLPESISQTAFQGFTGDLFHEDFRSTAISLRNKLSTPLAITISLISGYILRVIPKDDSQRMLIYQIFFLASTLFGIVEVVMFMLIKEPKNKEKKPKVDIVPVLRNLFKHKPFVRFTKSSLLFYFGWQMGWPLFSIYQVVNLGADEFWLSIIFVVSAIGSFVGYSFWNDQIRKRGNAIVASITTMGMATNPILLAISPNLYWAAALNFTIGFFTAGNVTVLLNGLLEATPDENRVLYVGAYNTLINISLTLSPLVAHSVLRLTGIFWALIIVGLVRISGSIVFYRSHIKGISEESG